ncbi:MAG TPA: POTRA domain-containing protein, partial [Bacteroidia bacterium]|nr:POTRA domain-containing protein [Bacteroidia bacterium]
MKRSRVRFAFILRSYILAASGIAILISFFSCNPTKKLHPGEYLLNNNRVIYRFGSPQKAKGLNNITNIGKEGIEQLVIPQKIAASEVLNYVKQKPNTRILFVFPFYLYLYNLPDSAKTANRKAMRDSAYRIKADKKGWKADKLKRKMDRKTGREWIMSQGEPPVIYDSSLTQKSTDQIKTFLFNKGYYDAQVKDSVHLSGKKADVAYILKPGKPFKINKIEYFFEDPGLASEIYSDTVDCMIRRGEIYDKDVLDAESDRLTTELNNAGFYYFSKQYVSYTLDTNSKTHLVDLSINIKRFVKRDPRYPDSTIETNHVYYRIRHVTIQMNYDPTAPAPIYHAGDTVIYDGLTIVYPHGHVMLKPNKFRLKIFVTPGDAYRVRNREDTYTGLSQLNEFSYISVKYIPVKDSNYVDCYIQLMPVVKHSIGAEFEVTNTGGDFGVQGDVSYLNHNQFKGAEQLTFKLNAGLIAQQLLTSSSNNNNISKYIPLNTIDLGPELDLTVPRPLFPFSLFNFKRRVNPQSTIKLSYDFQQRP